MGESGISRSGRVQRGSDQRSRKSEVLPKRGRTKEVLAKDTKEVLAEQIGPKRFSWSKGYDERDIMQRGRTKEKLAEVIGPKSYIS